MHSVQEGMWDPQPPSKHASPLPPAQPSSSSLHRPHVIADTPAKRITFYKSGDSQFGGVRMAVHKRSFKCFDALLDDLSQKVPLPFGVRTVTTPRGTHTIKHLEQLQDGGCYLCSDRRQAKPINMELARKHPGIWYNDTRRPHRPETSSSTATAHFPYRQRRILLVKNSEPGIRRSLVLSRRSTRSLRAFLDEVSEVMQFHVRKLYTAEGRRVKCVLYFNFGLETKKSIIHPRSDSSNRSARFSLSSEKSYGNGVSAYSQAKPAIMNEDIEKRVLVNKDGSLSVEMRVRFRLHSDETLQWSTQIKKSPSLTNDCSDPDSASYEQEGVHCSSQTLQHAADGNSCPCCYQRQEQQYDFWENPVHSCKPPPVPPQHAHSHSHTMMRHTHSSSSSSSHAHSRAQQLLPCLETRGPSALSVHSKTSAKSGRSKCRCGAASTLENAEELQSEEGSEVACSILSTKRQRRESGGTELPLSQNSGSVSLGLPEDTETGDSDSGKSTVSFNMNTESKGRVKTTTPATNTKKTSMKENVEGRGSTRSRKSNNNGNKSITPPKTPAVDIPTIETPGGIEDKGEDDLEPRCERSTSTAKVSNADVPNHRTPTAMSSASAKVGSKTKSKNQAPSRPASKTEGEEDNKAASVHSKSQCCLMPESAASAHLGSKVKESIGGDPAKPDSMDAVKSPKAKSTGSVNSRPQSKLALIKSSSPCPLHNSRPSSKEEDCSESTLSHSLSAADLLKEAIAARPHSRQSKASKASGKTRSEKCQRSRNQRGHVETPDLTPACLPNASPNEVVSEWLASIPTDSSMLTLGDEMNEDEDLLVEKAMDEKPGEEVSKEEESPEEGRVDNGENVEAKEEEEEEEEEKVEEAESDALDEKCLDQPPGDKVANSSSHNHLLSSRESLPKNWHSSAAVMKVLLGSSLGRCRSMPEVSPVYGRRLSTSARGLLDCLAQLQLIEPAVGPERDCQKPHNHHYQDIMTILQSLWLAEPENISTKDSGGDQITPPRSSSGVDMSSGSAGSGKENGNQGEDETNKIEAKETESLHEDEEVDKVADVEDGESEEPKEAETEPEETSTEHSSKSPTDNEQETLEDSSSGTPPTVLRAPLAKKLSQDPDPVWILHLLKKLEKQFMNHYITAMAEFKVRWDLDDSLILDTMISELKDEVSRRIQSSIEREMQKIQGRAGKGGRSPRPPMGGNLSRESTMTEKRRRMLKTADSLSDGENTADFSDQRSDDEYCPCDACVRKKMAARPLKTNPLAAEAPVMMEFDLLKILQLKKSPFPTPAAVPQVDVVEEGEGEGESNLEVDGAEATGEEEENDSGGGGEGDVVEEFKPEEGEEGDVDGNKKEDGALLQQFTRTSVESQPGSLEDIDSETQKNHMQSIVVPKMAAGVSTGGGSGNRRSRSPARVKRCKPKTSDVELGDF
uniref:Doublecortin domain-containing protein n=1 Tax=Labrus bergylta TaxID=56723 RepID=A0A3Q3NI19_9LABR